ncbi:unnamed protein product [Coffea canephora]|uniref:Uncharacterized protein n=1 Tax=Coffea canephora TaxID=49390 RepID=A0A068V1J6_COFCA|nr:unnamed protein product [Coffea canephora]
MEEAKQDFITQVKIVILNLFLGNICKTWTKEDVIDKVKQYGVANISGSYIC